MPSEPAADAAADALCRRVLVRDVQPLRAVLPRSARQLPRNRHHGIVQLVQRLCIGQCRRRGRGWRAGRGAARALADPPIVPDCHDFQNQQCIQNQCTTTSVYFHDAYGTGLLYNQNTLVYSVVNSSKAVWTESRCVVWLRVARAGVWSLMPSGVCARTGGKRRCCGRSVLPR